MWIFQIADQCLDRLDGVRAAGSNRDFLPLAQEVLRAGDLERLDSALFAKQDPLQAEREARFDSLRDALLAAERD